jgi:transposase
LRDLTRYRTTLLQERSRLANRLHKVLEDANLKLSSVISDVLGHTGRLILHALVQGETDAEKLADLALPRLAHKRAAIAQSLQGRVREHHRFLLDELLSAIEYHDQAVARLDRHIEEQMRPFEETIMRLDERYCLSWCMIYLHHHPVYHHRDEMAEIASQRRGGCGLDESK